MEDAPTASVGVEGTRSRSGSVTPWGCVKAILVMVTLRRDVMAMADDGDDGSEGDGNGDSGSNDILS